MGQYSHKTVEGKTKIAGEMLPTINRFRNTVMKYGYIKQLAAVLAIAQEALLKESQKISLSQAPRNLEAELKSQDPLAPQTRGVERDLLKLLLEEESFISVVKEAVELSDFYDQKIRSIIAAMFQLFNEGKTVNASVLMSHFTDEKILQFISHIAAAEEHAIDDKEKVCYDYLRRIKTDRLKAQRQHLLEEIKTAETAGDKNRLDELTQKFNQLIKG